MYFLVVRTQTLKLISFSYYPKTVEIWPKTELKFCWLMMLNNGLVTSKLSLTASVALQSCIMKRQNVVGN